MSMRPPCDQGFRADKLPDKTFYLELVFKQVCLETILPHKTDPSNRASSLYWRQWQYPILFIQHRGCILLGLVYFHSHLHHWDYPQLLGLAYDTVVLGRGAFVAGHWICVKL